MSNKPEHEASSTDREIVITRIFNAPRKLFWEVWTNPKHVAQWWGPRGFTTTVKELDLRPGGQSRYVMHGPDGTEYPVKGVFLEVVPYERIVSTDEFDEGFVHEDPAHLPQGIVLTCLFDDLGDKTKLTLRIAHPTIEDRRKHEEMGVVAGWNSSFDCLDDYLLEMGRTQVKTVANKIFVNLPVQNLKNAIAFFTKLGFTFNPQFTDETATCMIVRDSIFVMLLTHEKFQQFIPKAICDAKKSSEVLICLSQESRVDVDEMVRKAVAAGGSTYNQPQDHGFMYAHGFQDLDGHIWELVHMETPK